MYLYKYSAKDESGKTVRGQLEAEDVSQFYSMLEQDKLLCLDYSERAIGVQNIKTIYKLKTKDLILFCRKTNTMLKSGMSITSCLDILYSSAETPKLGRIYSNLYESIKGGMPLSAAMREEGEAFPPLLMNMVESGEESGNLDLMLHKLSIYYEKTEKTNAKIKTATTYPKLLAGLVVIVIMVLFKFVLPGIFETFNDMTLPLVTRFMMRLSAILTIYWYIVIALIILIIVGISFLLGIPAIRYQWDKFLLNAPVFGKLVRKIYSARFANTLAILYASGLTLLNALRLSVKVVGNTYIERTLTDVIESVSIGNSLSESLAHSNIFDRLLYSMINIGEETGSLDSILETTSDYYDQETDTAIEQLLSLLEPIMLVLLAIIIGSVLVSVILPIYGSYGQIAG